MKKLFSFLAVVVLIAQTILPNVMYAAPSVETGNPALDSAIEQLLNGGSLDDIFTNLEDIINNQTNSIFDDFLTDTLGGTVVEYKNVIVNALKTVAENIVNDTIAEIKAIEREEMKAKVGEIALAFAKGELTEEQVRGDIANVVNATVEKLEDTIYQVIKENVKTAVLENLQSENDASVILNVLQQNGENNAELSAALEALNAYTSFLANKDTLKAQLVAAFEAQNADCTDDELFPTDENKQACTEAKQAYTTVEDTLKQAQNLIDGAETVLTAAQTAIQDDLPSLLAPINTAISALETLLGISRDDDITEKKAEAEKQVENIQNEITAIKASNEYQQKEDELSAFNTERGKIISENAGLQNEIDKLEAELKSLQDNKSALIATEKTRIEQEATNEYNACSGWSKKACQIAAEVKKAGASTLATTIIEGKIVAKQAEIALKTLGSTAEIDVKILAKQAEITAMTAQKETEKGLAQARVALFSDENVVKWNDFKSQLDPESATYVGKNLQQNIDDAQANLRQAQVDMKCLLGTTLEAGESCSEGVVALADPDKTAAEKADAIIASLQSSYGVFDDLNKALTEAIDKAKEMLAESIAEGVAQSVKGGFALIAHPIADEVKNIANETIAGAYTLRNALEQPVKDAIVAVNQLKSDLQVIVPETEKIINQLKTLSTSAQQLPTINFDLNSCTANKTALQDYLNPLIANYEAIKTSLETMKNDTQFFGLEHSITLVNEILGKLNAVASKVNTLPDDAQCSDVLEVIHSALDIIDTMKSIAEDVIALAQDIPVLINDLIEDIKKAQDKLQEKIEKALTDMQNTIDEALNALPDFIKAQLTEVANKALEEVREVANQVKEDIKNLIENTLQPLAEDFIETVVQPRIEQTKGELAKLEATIAKNIIDLQKALEEKAKELKPQMEAFIEEQEDDLDKYILTLIETDCDADLTTLANSVKADIEKYVADKVAALQNVDEVAALQEALKALVESSEFNQLITDPKLRAVVQKLAELEAAKFAATYAAIEQLLPQSVKDTITDLVSVIRAKAESEYIKIKTEVESNLTWRIEQAKLYKCSLPDEIAVLETNIELAQTAVSGAKAGLTPENSACNTGLIESLATLEAKIVAATGALEGAKDFANYSQGDEPIDRYQALRNEPFENGQKIRFASEIATLKAIDLDTTLSGVVATCPADSTDNGNTGNGGGSSGGSTGGGSYGGGGGGSSYNPTVEDVVLSGETGTGEEENIEDILVICTDDEQICAYNYAYEKGITTMDTIEKARLNDQLTRAELAKMISQYAITVLGKTPDLSKDCSAFLPSIEKFKGQDLYQFMVTSCQLNLMGIHTTTYQPIGDFMGEKYVSRAEFGTVFSRLLWGNINEGTENNYYENHLNALKNANIITVVTPTLIELRGWVMLQIYRSVK